MPLISSYQQNSDIKETIRIGNWTWRVSFWEAQLAVWGAYSIVPAFLWMSGILKNQDALYFACLRPFSGALITFAARPLWKRLPQANTATLALGFYVILINFPLALIDYFGCVWTLHAFGVYPQQTQASVLLTGLFGLRWGTLVVWTLLYLIAKQLIHTAALREIVRSTELATLRAQIHPHFLFNALNSTIAEAANAESVRQITQSLADFLRFSLKQRSGNEPLGEELTALEDYLQVQKVRFEAKLEYKIDAEPAAAACSAPSFLILPLLENALKYGQQTSAFPLKIYIAASIRKKQLCIVVKNTGKWVEPNSAASLNTGLHNLRRRLNLLYGDRASLSIDQTEDGILANIQLPVTTTLS